MGNQIIFVKLDYLKKKI